MERVENDLEETEAEMKWLKQERLTWVSTQFHRKEGEEDNDDDAIGAACSNNDGMAL